MGLELSVVDVQLNEVGQKYEAHKEGSQNFAPLLIFNGLNEVGLSQMELFACLILKATDGDSFITDHFPRSLFFFMLV